MGDAVNLAARLEPANKDYKTRIILGQGTYELAKEKIAARMLDRLVVKGKSEPVTIYELLDAPLEGTPISIPEWVAHYERGYKLHAERKWSEAREAFSECIRMRGNDGASEAMLMRIALYENEEPPQQWHGEWVRKAKD
jgi:adenylate cyclase